MPTETTDRTYTTPPQTRGKRREINPFATVTTQVTEEQLAWLDRIAVEGQRSRAVVVRTLLDFCMRNETAALKNLP